MAEALSQADDPLTCLEEALAHAKTALNLLDHAGARADIGAHMDMAVSILNVEIKRLTADL